MEFDSLIFLFVFFPVFLAGLVLLRREARPAYLLLASLVFYAWAGGRSLYFLLAVIVGDYLFGRMVAGARAKSLRKAALLAGIVLNVGALVFFKYAGFFAQSFRWTWVASALRGVVAPLGISFIAFQGLSFLIDVYRQPGRLDRSLVRFGLFLAFFPKLISGPLVPYRSFGKRLEAPPSRPDELVEGVRRFILGLGKKVLLADALRRTADSVFAIPSANLTAGLAWLGIAVFTLEIYFDFAGYTDMAVGLGLLCGYRLPENFNYPYISRSIGEFWRRWHMSLSRWIQEYLFLPMAYAFSRKIKADRVLGIRAESWAYGGGIMIAFTLCGLWHGARWTFVAWGAYYGLWLAVEHAGLRKRVRRLPAPLGWAYALLLVMIGWVFFRSASMGYAFGFIRALFGFGTGDGIRYYPGLYLNGMAVATLAAGCLGIFPVFPWASKALALAREAATGGRSRIAASLWSAGFLLAENLGLFLVFGGSLLALATETHRPFIYFQF